MAYYSFWDCPKCPDNSRHNSCFDLPQFSQFSCQVSIFINLLFLLIIITIIIIYSYYYYDYDYDYYHYHYYKRNALALVDVVPTLHQSLLYVKIHFFNHSVVIALFPIVISLRAHPLKTQKRFC